MHLSYLPEDPYFENDDENAVVEKIRQRRAPGPLWTLDRTLLHSPPLADGWNTFVGAIRTKMSLPADLRETAFLRVAAVTNCWFEWDIHSPIAQESGVSKEGINHGILHGEEGNYKGLTDHQRIVVEYADAVSSSVCIVDEELVNRLRQFLSERQVVELTGCVAGFNLVGRFISALDIGEKNGEKGRSTRSG